MKEEKSPWRDGKRKNKLHYTLTKRNLFMETRGWRNWTSLLASLTFFLLLHHLLFMYHLYFMGWNSSTRIRDEFISDSKTSFSFSSFVFILPPLTYGYRYRKGIGEKSIGNLTILTSDTIVQTEHIDWYAF